MDVKQTKLSPSEIETLSGRIDRPIVLVGMMGVGKSSVGKRLATALNFDFVDADDEIEESARLSIAEIFDKHGEAYFRDGERRVITRLLHEGGKRAVIATGGGAFCNEETRTIIHGKAISVWLDSDIDTLVERTSRKNNRPLLKVGDPRDILTRLLDVRKDDYSQAAVHVQSGKGPHSQTVNRILRGIDQWL